MSSVPGITELRLGMSVEICRLIMNHFFPLPPGFRVLSATLRQNNSQSASASWNLVPLPTLGNTMLDAARLGTPVGGTSADSAYPQVWEIALPDAFEDTPVVGKKT
jgi:hypothetical protein